MKLEYVVEKDSLLSEIKKEIDKIFENLTKTIEPKHLLTALTILVLSVTTLAIPVYEARIKCLTNEINCNNTNYSGGQIVWSGNKITSGSYINIMVSRYFTILFLLVVSIFFALFASVYAHKWIRYAFHVFSLLLLSFAMGKLLLTFEENVISKISIIKLILDSGLIVLLLMIYLILLAAINPIMKRITAKIKYLLSKIKSLLHSR